MAHFEYTSLIEAPREKVFGFMIKPENLIRIMPEDYKVESSSLPNELKKHLQYDFRISRYGVSVLWGVVIEEFEKDVLYKDRQTHGPFSYWLHTHKFEDHSQGCLCKDTIEYDLPFGIFGKLAMDLYFKRELERVFAFRQKRLQEMLGKNQ